MMSSFHLAFPLAAEGIINVARTITKTMIVLKLDISYLFMEKTIKAPTYGDKLHFWCLSL